jgi:tetratricopeptide (TPR) repeat protein
MSSAPANRAVTGAAGKGTDPADITQTSRLAAQGRTMADLARMASRQRLTETLLLLAATAGVAGALTVATGGPWPALITLPTVVAVLLLTAKAASPVGWGILTALTIAGLALHAAPLWVSAAIVVGVLLRRRLTWRIRNSRPKSLARCTPLWALALAGPRRGIPLRYGLVQLRAGHRDGAHDLLTYVLNQSPRRADKTARAAANIGLAALARERADITTGLAHVRAAEDLLPGRRPRRLSNLRTLEYGLLLRDAARHQEAVGVLTDASRSLRRAGDRKGAVTALTAAASSAMHLDPRRGLGAATEARELAVRALDLSGLVGTELLLAQAAVAIEDGAMARRAAKTVIDLVSQPVSSYAEADEDARSAVDERAAARGSAHFVLAREAAASGNHDEALSHAAHAQRLSHLAGRAYDTASAELVAADIHEQRGQLSTALRHALTAVAHLDQARYLLPTPRWRADWVRSNERAYGRALRLAVARDDGRLVAELVETSRLQAVPRPPAAHETSAQGAWLLPTPELTEPRRQDRYGADFRTMGKAELKAAAAQAALGTDPLQPSPIVTIDGLPLLPHAVATSHRLRVDVTEQVERLAGVGAWWWGAAIADGVYYWAVRGDSGFSCGSTSLAEGTDGSLTLKDLLDATPTPGVRQTNPISGPFGWARTDDPYRRERDFAWRLSETFLPYPLRQQALRVLQQGRQAPASRPFHLVVSLPAALSALPVALLALGQPPTGDTGVPDVPRLLEAAVITLAPSMALLASIAGRPPLRAPSTRSPWPLLLSIVDPSDDLRHAQCGLAPRVLLTGWGHLRRQGGAEASRAARPATKAHLKDVLLTFPDRAGLLTYAGHAYPGYPDTPATGGLVLASPRPVESAPRPAAGSSPGDAVTGAERLLTSRELLAADKERATYQFPARVLLSACSAAGFGQTSQSTPGLDGEWLGVAAAVMQAGADEVIATLFDLIDDEGTARFEDRLASLLLTTPTAAAALRLTQIEALAEWRAGSGNPQSVAPLIWAAYACLGGPNTTGDQT